VQSLLGQQGAGGHRRVHARHARSDRQSAADARRLSGLSRTPVSMLDGKAAMKTSNSRERGGMTLSPSGALFPVDRPRLARARSSRCSSWQRCWQWPAGSVFGSPRCWPTCRSVSGITGRRSMGRGGQIPAAVGKAREEPVTAYHKPTSPARCRASIARTSAKGEFRREDGAGRWSGALRRNTECHRARRPERRQVGLQMI
jgi:hypothetical protein